MAQGALRPRGVWNFGSGSEGFAVVVLDILNDPCWGGPASRDRPDCRRGRARARGRCGLLGRPALAALAPAVRSGFSTFKYVQHSPGLSKHSKALEKH